MILKLKKWFKRLTWSPRKNIIYKGKFSGHRGNQYTSNVEIIVDGKQSSGSFSVGNKWCEIRAGRLCMILPKDKVTFTKNVRRYDTIRKYGQNGGAGVDVTYTAKVESYSKEDLDRFNEFKAS